MPHSAQSVSYVTKIQRSGNNRPSIRPRALSMIRSHSLSRARCNPFKLLPHHYDVAPPRSLPTPSSASPTERWRDSTASSHDSSTAPMASGQIPTCFGELGQRTSHRPVKLSADLHESHLLRIHKQVDEFGNDEFEDRQDARDANTDRIHAFAIMAILASLATWRSAVRQPICESSVICHP